MTANPARPGPGVRLCRVDELADPGTKGFVFREESALFSGFVLRRGEEVTGFVDSCPHAGWRLAGIGDNFLTRDERHILCSGHGALFNLDDGECVSGPCFGDRLEAWPVRVEDGVIWTDEAASHKAPPYWGGCRCGAVRFQVRAAPMNVRVCHCRICQKTTGQPFFARAMFARDAVEISGRTERHPSSARIDRAFCPRCGTPLFAEPKDAPARIGVSLGAFDDANALPPTEHIFVASKVDWLQLDDGLPQFQERPPS